MPSTHGQVLARMFDGHRGVRERLRCAVVAMQAAQIPCAVTGHQAIAAWISTIEPTAVRGTPELELLVEDLEAASDTSVMAGFLRSQQPDLLLSQPTDQVREALRITPIASLPSTRFCTDLGFGFNVVDLAVLVRMQLERHRLANRVNVRDLLDVGLIDRSWTSGLPYELRVRLQHLIDTPEG